MEITGMQIGFDALISMLSAVIGAMTVWFTLKNKVEIQQVILSNLDADMQEIKSNKKEGQATMHKRIDVLKKQVESNREKTDESLSDIKTEMKDMELRIIQAIHEINKK
jgi:hypothetical protein